MSPLLTGPRAAQLETLLPVDVISILAPIYSFRSEFSTASSLPQEQASRHFDYALRVFGEALAQLAPLIIILDDVQWASSVLWESLDSLSQGLTENGALLILAYRRKEIEHSVGWEKLQAWEKARGLKIIALQPLTLEETTQLVADQSQVEPVVIHALTRGNPFFI
ncbi:MAG: hypothetical protein HC806_05560, partial [Anaerolineae bacterium]|nr:hypothetical protein [Anaerolineae bacterium]